MSMSTWAEREVELAIKWENKDKKEGETDIATPIYQSALKAFKSLMEDGHSGSSIAYTRDILMRLLTNRPLTVIEDTPEVWSGIADISHRHGEKVNYQCIRMSSLFKYIYEDGSVKYKDVDRCIGCNIDDESATYHNGLISRIMDEMWPIKMPYYPGGQTKFYCEEFLTDRKNGDYDTVGVLRARRPDGTIVQINRYFKEGEKEWIEISREEYHDRNRMHIVRETAEKMRVLANAVDAASNATTNMTSTIKEVSCDDQTDGRTDAGTAGATESCSEGNNIPVCDANGKT